MCKEHFTVLTAAQCAAIPPEAEPSQSSSLITIRQSSKGLRVKCGENREKVGRDKQTIDPSVRGIQSMADSFNIWQGADTLPDVLSFFAFYPCAQLRRCCCCWLCRHSSSVLSMFSE